MIASLTVAHHGHVVYPPLRTPAQEAALSAVESVTEARLMALHQDGSGQRKSISTALREAIGRQLSLSGWRVGASPLGKEQGGRAIWQVSYVRERSVIQLGFGNRESIMRHLTMPLVCCRRYWLQDGGTSTDAVVIAPSTSLCETGGFDNSYGTAEEMMTGALLVTEIAQWEVGVVSVGALQSSQIQQFTGRNNRTASRLRPL